MIDNILNLLFRCGHNRLTRPITPASKGGVRDGDTYVVCLECGKQFSYDLNEMRVGKPIPVSPTVGVLDREPPKSNKKIKYAALASALPLAWLIGKSLKRSNENDKDSQNP